MRFKKLLKAYNQDCENIIELMLDENIPTDDASPNFVADFAWNHGYEDLSSNEIVWISDNYENTNYKNSKKSKLLKASEWKVERRHHDTENGEDYYYIWGPEGEYCDADGEPYRFDSREDALEEVEYLRAEHKGNEKAKKVKSAYGYDTFDEVLEMQIKYLKSIKAEAERYLALCEETMREIEAGNIENNLDDFSMKGQVESLEKLVDIDVELTNAFEY